MRIGKYSRWSILFAGALGGLLVVIGLLSLRLEMVVYGEGRIMARAEHPLFAPKDAVIESIHVATGQAVAVGDLLYALRSDAVQEKWMERRVEHLDVLADLAQAELDLRAWAIRPGSPELITASDRLTIHDQIMAIQDELSGMYASIREKQVISQLDFSLREIERLRAQIQRVETSAQAGWQDAGLTDVDRARLEQRHAALQKHSAALQEELKALSRQRDALNIRAPVAGRVSVVDHRHVGAWVAAGERLAVVIDPEYGMMARVYAPPRNIDMVRSGQRVKIDSSVFNSMLEGYMEGEVIRVAPDTVRVDDPRYEVDMSITTSPYEPVLGAPVEARILLGRRPWYHVLVRTTASRQAKEEASQP